MSIFVLYIIFISSRSTLFLKEFTVSAETVSNDNLFQILTSVRKEIFKGIQVKSSFIKFEVVRSCNTGHRWDLSYKTFCG